MAEIYSWRRELRTIYGTKLFLGLMKTKAFDARSVYKLNLSSNQIAERQRVAF